MATLDGILMTVSPPGQITNGVRTNDAGNTRDCLMMVEQLQTGSTKLTITMELLNCDVVNMDPATVSRNQVFIEIDASTKLIKANQNADGLYTRGPNNDHDTSQVFMALEFKATGGKVGGPGVDAQSSRQPFDKFSEY